MFLFFLKEGSTPSMEPKAKLELKTSRWRLELRSDTQPAETPRCP